MDEMVTEATAIVAAAPAAAMGGVDWRVIDRELRRVARSQAALDAQELSWLALAQDAEIHRELGMASMLEYVERVLGHGPKAGHERLRVARELKALPLTRAALEQGRLSFSAVRELSRKVTAKTEHEWLAAVHGKCLREIEELLSGHEKGDRPNDPIDPDLQLRKITLELTPPTMALFREASRRLEDELGHRLTDDEIMVAMCATVLGGGGCGDAVDSWCGDGDSGGDITAAVGDVGAIGESSRDGASSRDASPRGDGCIASGTSPPRGDAETVITEDVAAGSQAVESAAAEPAVTGSNARGVVGPAAIDPSPREDGSRRKAAPRVAPYQIALTVCPGCDRGWHDAGGRAIAVPDSTIAQAICDAQYLGRTDLLTPERAEQEIAPATARLVHRRDRGRCQVPGCRSARWLHIHHIVWREHGGSNDPRNLICLCFAHHQAVHQYKISVTGTAPDGLVFDLGAYERNAIDVTAVSLDALGRAATSSAAVQRHP